MSGFLALVRKQLTESRWMLGLSALALFWFSWLSVYVTFLGQGAFRRMARARGFGNRAPGEMLRALAGGDVEITSGALEMQFWIHPFFVLPVILWAISRGSLAVAGEVERGTMDLVLSRPIPRWSYLLSQVTSAVLGFLLLAIAPVLGNLLGTRFNPVEGPPTLAVLLRPAASLTALGLAIYGYTLLLSSVDLVRWRPVLIGSVLTLGGYVAFVIAVIPVFAESWWKPWLERVSVFKAYNPVEAITDVSHLAFNVGLLSGIGLAGVVLALLAFGYRDLPTSG